MVGSTSTKLLRILFLLILLSGVLFAFKYNEDLRSKINELYSEATNTPQKVETTANVKKEDPIAPREINTTSAPLIDKRKTPGSYLTVQGVIDETNRHRALNGLAPLKQNPTLNKSADIKNADMFAKQYFEHDSPEGRGVSDLAEDVHYEYLAIGENLALGNFENDKVLVQGWMDSPGHRENILNKDYKEIGVSVMQGTYEGQKVWMSVQHFGRPMSDCPAVDDELREDIEEKTEKQIKMEKELEDRREELEEDNQENAEEYNQKVDEYNDLAKEYNKLIEEVEDMLEEYNDEVKEFNECVE